MNVVAATSRSYERKSKSATAAARRWRRALVAVTAAVRLQRGRGHAARAARGAASHALAEEPAASLAA
jgi:hypothetical protein